MRHWRRDVKHWDKGGEHGPVTEADLAVNIERPQASGQVCSKLCDYRLRLCASRDYLARHPPIARPADLQGHRFVGYVEELVFSNALRYFAEAVPQAHTAVSMPA